MSSQTFMKQFHERYMLSYLRLMEIRLLFSRSVFWMDWVDSVHTSSNDMRSQMAYIWMTVALRKTWHSTMLSRFFTALAT